MKVSLNSETVEIFYEFLGNGFKVKPETGILKKISKNDKYIKNIHLRYMKLKPG